MKINKFIIFFIALFISLILGAPKIKKKIHQYYHEKKIETWERRIKEYNERETTKNTVAEDSIKHK